MRRRLSIALALLAVGVLLLYLSTSQVWFTLHGAAPGFGPALTGYKGGNENGFSALALGVLAAGAALLATKGLGRRLVAGLAGLLGAGTIALAIHAIVDREALVRDFLVSRHYVHMSGSVTSSAWPYVGVASGVFVVVGAVMGSLAGGGGLSAKYESPAGRPPAPVAVSPDFADVATWQALDRDEDPTGG